MRERQNTEFSPNDGVVLSDEILLSSIEKYLKRVQSIEYKTTMVQSERSSGCEELLKRLDQLVKHGLTDDEDNVDF